MNPPRPHEAYDHAYGCKRINGVLSPEPLDSSTPQPSTSEGPSTRGRPITASEVVETKEISFTLYQCQRTRVYILHLREVVTDSISAYILELLEHSSGKRRVKARKTRDNAPSLVPVAVEQEIFPDNEGTSSDLSIKQRLEGRWRKEIRSRTTSAVKEPFYYHERVRGAMRSIGEVATFIICNDVY